MPCGAVRVPKASLEPVNNRQNGPLGHPTMPTSIMGHPKVPTHKPGSNPKTQDTPAAVQQAQTPPFPTNKAVLNRGGGD